MIEHFQLEALTLTGHAALNNCLRVGRGLKPVVINRDPLIIRFFLEGRLKRIVKAKDVYGFIPFLLKRFRCKEGVDYKLSITEK